MTFFVMYMSHEDECFRKILQQYLQCRIIVVFFLTVVEGKEEMNNLLDALMDSLSIYAVTVV